MEATTHSARQHYNIRLPRHNEGLNQDEEWFEATIDGRRRRILIHDYATLYDEPRLYEALVYDALKCSSPERLVHLLEETLRDLPDDPADLRILDLGAGNGIVGEYLRDAGVEHIVGLDLLDQARDAAERDRPDVYDDYIVADLSELDEDVAKRLKEHRFNALVTVAALGFGDVPPIVFANAVNAVASDGWIAMTIKEDFLDPADSSGFGRLLRLMIERQVIHVQAMQRYRHRVSVEGEPLFYVALVAKKLNDIPATLIDAVETGGRDADQRRNGDPGDDSDVPPTAALLAPPE